MNFHCVPNQVLYQAEPLPDMPEIEAMVATQKLRGQRRPLRQSIAFAIVSLSPAGLSNAIAYVTVVEATGRREVSYRMCFPFCTFES